MEICPPHQPHTQFLCCHCLNEHNGLIFLLLLEGYIEGSSGGSWDPMQSTSPTLEEWFKRNLWTECPVAF